MFFMFSSMLLYVCIGVGVCGGAEWRGGCGISRVIYCDEIIWSQLGVSVFCPMLAGFGCYVFLFFTDEKWDVEGWGKIVNRLAI